jgi:hypothetical protein
MVAKPAASKANGRHSGIHLAMAGADQHDREFENY